MQYSDNKVYRNTKFFGISRRKILCWIISVGNIRSQIVRNILDFIIIYKQMISMIMRIIVKNNPFNIAKSTFRNKKCRMKANLIIDILYLQFLPTYNHHFLGQSIKLHTIPAIYRSITKTKQVQLLPSISLFKLRRTFDMFSLFSSNP